MTAPFHPGINRRSSALITILSLVLFISLVSGSSLSSITRKSSSSSRLTSKMDDSAEESLLRRKRPGSPQSFPLEIHDNHQHEQFHHDGINKLKLKNNVQDKVRKLSIYKLLQLVGGGGVSSKSTSATTVLNHQLLSGLKTLSYFALWFALNIYYNIVNKQVLNALPLPIFVATIQLGIGSAYVLSCWLLHIRARPYASEEGLRSLWPIAVYHGSGQIFTVLSLGAAAVSFTHIVKAMEPFFSALVAAVAFKQIFKLPVYLSLVPVVVGVSVACANDVSFGWLAFLTAMASNLAFALRANYSKLSMEVFRKEKEGMNNNNRNMTAANIYGVVTILSFLLCIPWVLALEGTKLFPIWQKSIQARGGGGVTSSSSSSSSSSSPLLKQIFLSGLFHYLNNEVMYLALDNVHPITLAVGNTAKRVFIIIASLMVFRNPITLTGAIGSTVGIAGVLIYSITKQYYDSHT